MCVRHALTERRALINNKCETCPAGKTSTGSHNASGGDATCDATTCGANKKIVNNKCETCPAGKTSTGSHDASGGDQHDASGGNTVGEATTCGPNEKVVNHAVWRQYLM